MNLQPCPHLPGDPLVSDAHAARQPPGGVGDCGGAPGAGDARAVADRQIDLVRRGVSAPERVPARAQGVADQRVAGQVGTGVQVHSDLRWKTYGVIHAAPCRYAGSMNR